MGCFFSGSHGFLDQTTNNWRISGFLKRKWHQELNSTRICIYVVTKKISWFLNSKTVSECIKLGNLGKRMLRVVRHGINFGLCTTPMTKKYLEWYTVQFANLSYNKK